VRVSFGLFEGLFCCLHARAALRVIRHAMALLLVDDLGRAVLERELLDKIDRLGSGEVMGCGLVPMGFGIKHDDDFQSTVSHGGLVLLYLVFKVLLQMFGYRRSPSEREKRRRTMPM